MYSTSDQHREMTTVSSNSLHAISISSNEQRGSDSDLHNLNKPFIVNFSNSCYHQNTRETLIYH